MGVRDNERRTVAKNHSLLNQHNRTKNTDSVLCKVNFILIVLIDYYVVLFIFKLSQDRVGCVGEGRSSF